MTMNGAEVHFLNVGWGDAHVVRMPSGGVTLIDGGDEHGAGEALPDRDHPLHWLNRHGYAEVEWMVLTHLHEDHLNGLLAVAEREEIRVKRALLPYEPFRLPPANPATALTPLAASMHRMLAAYLTMIDRLLARGTIIVWRERYDREGSEVVWEESGIRFAHEYPWRGDPLPARQLLPELAKAEQAESELLERFFEASNHDSSVYRLSCGDAPATGVLFGGDQLEPGWERLAGRRDLACEVWKAAHHGLPDGCNERILGWIRPAYGVIPIDSARSAPYAAEWERLKRLTGIEFQLTSASAYGWVYRLNRHADCGSIGK
ncbi:MBL fold metallo-hydrolase [Paenibacillus lycopersici]|uniref:MBL fold metallo-hydrolase n=1 Tax=Paenibacillus lycopersici TaxID=2704462 RepID=A0A6C0FXT2_9BACL|nr:MBL fold metallo-hydrolase [Paenibacillus lycopersici]QHT61507.1 MBL fold metallo-hydrolase [Paenibacillus lycopersici]